MGFYMEKDKLDSKDLLLLDALKKNSRASLVSLARDIGLSRSATHDRILKLEESGIINRFTIDIDRTLLPMTRAFLSINFSTGSAQKELANIIHAIDGIEAVYCLSGDIDMLAYCECNSDDALSSLRDDIARLDGVVSLSTRHVLTSSLF